MGFRNPITSFADPDARAAAAAAQAAADAADAAALAAQSTADGASSSASAAAQAAAAAQITANTATSSAGAANTAAAAAQTAATTAGTAAAAAQSTADAANTAAHAITATQITDGAVTTPKLAAGAVTAATIGAGAVTAGKLDAGAVTAGTIAAGAVQAGAVAAGAIDGQTITGALLRTAASGQRVQIDSTNGLVAVNAAGQAVTQVRPSDGVLIAAGAQITGQLDTGTTATTAGVRVYEASDATGTWGTVEFRDGIQGDTAASITGKANLTAQGGGTFTAQGGQLTLQAGSYNGVPGPSVGLRVESAPAGGYQAVGRLNGAPGGWILDGPLSLINDLAWTSYTATWTASGSAPTLGNGTLTALYRRLGRLVEVDLFLVFGSTTSGGTGNFLFTLPFPAATTREQYLAGKYYTSDGNNYLGFGLIVPANNGKVQPYAPVVAGGAQGQQAVSNATPAGATGTGVPTIAGKYTFGSGNNLALFGRYETAS